MKYLNRNTVTRFVATAMVAAMTIGTSFTAFAAGGTASGNAEPSEKEEVVYVMTDAAGATKSVYVVNSFSGGDIVDYGNYTSVKMLTTTDPITQDGDMITFSTNADKAYYQGELKDAEIPWDISIQYFIDGTEYAPEDVAGMSGALEIRFTVEKNEACEAAFYDNYALQASFTLDTDSCKNIEAADATVANVGSSKQLTYTILPGKGIETSIFADVTDFEMDAAAINGISLNLNIEIDNADLMDEVTDLMDATAELNDGAGDLKDGTSDLLDGAGELKDGAGDLKDGASTLSEGASALDKGIAALQEGMGEVQSGLDALNAQSDSLVGGSAQVKAALDAIQSALDSVSVTTDDLETLVAASEEIGAGITEAANGAQALEDMVEDGTISIDASASGLAGMIYQQAFTTGLADLASGLATLDESYAEFDSAINEIVAMLSGMAASLVELKGAISQLVDRYGDLDAGIGAYTTGVAQIVSGYGQVVDGFSSLASGSKELSDGASELFDGTSDLYDGAKELNDGVSDLNDGAKELYDGTSELADATSGMDTKIDDTIDDMVSSITGNADEIASFVSAKNTNVDAVQFVIKTDAIAVVEVEETGEVEEAATGFWQKLAALFKRG